MGEVNSMTIEKKIFPAEVKACDDEKLIIDHFISTVTEDSGGDIMEPDGMVIRGKAVVLFQHGQDARYGNEPIAKPLSFSVGMSEKGVKGIIARTQYYDGSKLSPPDNTGRRLYEKAKLGFMPNWSIGWYPIEYTPTANGGRHVKKWGLTEYSQVAVGMNEEATTEDSLFLKELPTVQYKSEEQIPIPACVTEELVLTTCTERAHVSPVLPSAKENRFEKSLSERIATEVPMRALYTIFEGILAELCSESLEDSGTTAEEIANEILSEAIDVLVPHMIAFVNECRMLQNAETETDQAYPTMTKRVKDMFTNAEEPIEQETPTADPAPVVETVLSIKEVPPVVVEKVTFAPDVAKAARQGVTVAEIKGMLLSAISDQIPVLVAKEIRKLQGKLD